VSAWKGSLQNGCVVTVFGSSNAATKVESAVGIANCTDNAGASSGDPETKL